MGGRLIEGLGGGAIGQIAGLISAPSWACQWSKLRMSLVHGCLCRGWCPGTHLGGALGAHLGPILFGTHLGIFFICLGSIWTHFGPWDTFGGARGPVLLYFGLFWGMALVCCLPQVIRLMDGSHWSDCG